MRFVFHPGLPKTATTFLQECCFPNVSHPSVYLGKHLQRERDSLFVQLIREYVYGPEQARVGLLGLVAHEVEQLAAAGVTQCLYSDEMLLVDSSGLRWQDKVERLAEVTQSMERDILLTVRDPADGLYSLYVELYPTMNRAFRDPATFVERSNQARIYHFEYLETALRRNFPDACIDIIGFDEVPGLRPEHPVLRRLGVEQVTKRVLNAKERAPDGSYVSAPVTLRSVVARLGVSAALKRFVPVSAWEWISRRSSSVELKKGSPRPRFPEELVAWINEAYRADVQHLRVRHGCRINGRAG